MKNILEGFSVCVLSCLCLLSVPAFAEIYKSVDKNGKVTYSSVPPANVKSEIIEVKKPLILPATPNTYTPTPNQNYQNNYAYEIAITSPESGTELSPDDRSISIGVSLNQALEEGDLIVYKLDEKQIASSTETQLVLDEPPRGEHQLTAEVVDEKGEVLAKSEPVSFVVMRPLVKKKAPPSKGQR